MSDCQRYYDTLKRIARQYQRSEQILRHAEREYGLEPCEALEYAYDNIQHEAEMAIKRKRRPKS